MSYSFYLMDINIWAFESGTQRFHIASMMIGWMWKQVDLSGQYLWRSYYDVILFHAFTFGEPHMRVNRTSWVHRMELPVYTCILWVQTAIIQLGVIQIFYFKIPNNRPSYYDDTHRYNITDILIQSYPVPLLLLRCNCNIMIRCSNASHGENLWIVLLTIKEYTHIIVIAIKLTHSHLVLHRIIQYTISLIII